MTTAQADQQWIEKVEQARDLRGQLGELARDEFQEISFTEWSPGRKIVTLWSLETGEEIQLPRYIAASALGAKDQTGKYRFTTNPENAPKPRIGMVKCFLHRESPERALLDEIGISRTCHAEHLANTGSKRVHAQKRHKDEWAQYQEYLNEQETKAYKDREAARDAVFERIAGKAVGVPDAKPAKTSQDLPCPQCDFTAKNNFGLQAHIRGKHKET